ncbi:LLM class flavin-dependent oxidoreductase [Pseudomonas sp. CCC3.1]|uniref:LLM class flavin-dependent oxidoreductase n=1 Tax=Pseudomonas sp. CCC3.1 TaxID=3048607 RepID=UPI002AC93C03|nr:LLM class flavin-dependent oxidoreductase [Pseudomonas sp. CCC3.1]MEB0206068.1 LLM class flavin-dependent oxidoreductase [Pseudomonas sp. CCC3.1]WPX36734.1 LLM class flavin-dependent oxidoreductase [Pseudomonas sp. CCC3.1]
MTTRHMSLGAFIMSSGHHLAAWRHPRAWAGGGLNFQHFKQLAQTAERGKFDAIFFADNLALMGTPELGQYTTAGDVFDPLVLLSGLATVTERIGLISTVSTSYNEPYLLARKFASLDHLSDGRSGWNLVTSATDLEALNFGREQHFEHDDRYQRAEEFIDVVTGLWDSYEDDAFVRDKASGTFFEAEKLHVLGHKGQHYRVRGPLNIPRPPQGYPVLIQAGSSEPGKALAARTAEVVFTAQQTLANAQAFYADVKGRLAGYGRTPDQLRVMPGISPVIGSSQDEADEKYQQLQDLLDPRVGLGLLAGMAGGFDLSGYDLDGPLPELPVSNSMQSRQALFIELARRENLSIRQLYLKIAGARGHHTVIGTPKTVADTLEQWFVEQGADGFNIMPPFLPEGLHDFVDGVVPILQQRGLFRREYSGTTLREHLGLQRPSNRYSA